MTQPPTPGPGTPESAVENVAALILQSVQQAARDILDASVKAAGEITAAATAVPTALSTPPSQGVTPEQLVTAFEAMQTNQAEYGGESEWGPPLDPEIDYIVDSQGTRWNPNPGDEPIIPSMEREAFAIVPPGTPLLPNLARLD